MTSTFVALIDFLGTFAFAISGGLVAVRHRLDLFGVLVLAFAAATAGGILRDVVLDVMPAAVVDWRYLAVSTAAGLLTFWRHEQVERLRNPVQISDAIGLALFALVPFSRLVHAFTVPLHYLFRPYVVYRSRDAVPPAPSRGRVRGWDPVGTPDRERDPR